MTAAAAREILEPLIGTELGIGDWTAVSKERLAKFGAAIGQFGAAIGQSVDEIPALLVLALIPSMVSQIELPIETPRLTVNYGLDRCRMISSPSFDQRIRARASLSGVDLGKDWLQVKRHIDIESEKGSVVLEADTITRLLW
jgi:acyl dehydratase